MNRKSYIINFAYDLAYIDSDTVVVKSSFEQFRIKGNGIATAVQDVLNFFVEPCIFDDVIPKLVDKYRDTALRQMLDYLASKGVLISIDKCEEILGFDKIFLDKVYTYNVLSGKTLDEIHVELSAVKIGIIGASQLSQNLLSNLMSSNLLLNFSVGVTDDENAEFNELLKPDNVSLIYHYAPINSIEAQSIIRESDFIIVNSNYHNHPLFKWVNELCLIEGKTWVRIVTDGLNAEVGPLFIPYDSCCYSCLHFRSQSNMNVEELAFDNIYADHAIHSNSKEESIKHSTFYPVNSLSASIAYSEIMRHLIGMRSSLINQCIKVYSSDFSLKRDHIHKYYNCVTCAKGGAVSG